MNELTIKNIKETITSRELLELINKFRAKENKNKI